MNFLSVLIAATGLLILNSEPEGAKIVIDGSDYGETPRLITSLDNSFAHKVVLSKERYKPTEFRFSFEGRKPKSIVHKLMLNAGKIVVNTEPSGAKCVINGNKEYTTPFVVDDVPTGASVLRFSLDGYENRTESINIVAGDELNLNYPLTPKQQEIVKAPPPSMNKGRLEIRTNPPGAQVILDGRNLGATRVDYDGAEFSNVFHVNDLDVGEHTLVLRKEGYKEVVRHPIIKKDQTSKHHKVVMARVFKPNVEVTTVNGVIRGVLGTRTDKYMTVETKLGAYRTILISDIKDIKYLTD